MTPVIIGNATLYLGRLVGTVAANSQTGGCGRERSAVWDWVCVWGGGLGFGTVGAGCKINQKPIHSDDAPFDPAP